MIKLALAVIALTASAYAQQATIPDCRTAQLAIGDLCEYRGSSVSTERYIGDVNLPPFAHMTEPVSLEEWTKPHPAVVAYHPWTFAGLYSIQTETLGYKRYVSDGFKVSAVKQWTAWRGLDIRGTAINKSVLEIGHYPGKSHTYSAEFGPRIAFGHRVTAYGESLIGVAHQQYYGMSTSGVAGISVRLGHSVSLIPVDATYRYVLLQSSNDNPRQGRIELGAGLSWKVGR